MRLGMGLGLGREALGDGSPVYIGGLQDMEFEEDLAISTLDISPFFTGAGLTYGASPLPDGLSIDTNTGEITGTPTTVQALTEVTASATNSYGIAIGLFNVAVQPAPIGQPISTGAQAWTVDEDTGDQTFDVRGMFEVTGDPTHSGTTFALTATAASSVIDGHTITITTADAVVDGTITVEATNVEGSATEDITLNVIAAATAAAYGDIPNKSVEQSSGTRFHGTASYATGTPTLTYSMAPSVLRVDIIDNGDGTYGRFALIAGGTSQDDVGLTTATAWELDGTPIGGETSETIDAEALELEGDLTCVVTASYSGFSDGSLESAATPVSYGAVVNPVHLGTTIGGTNGATSYGLAMPAYSAGDLVIISVRVGQGFISGGHGNVITLSTAGGANVGPDGEAITTVLATFDNVTSNDDISQAVYSYIAAANQAAGEIFTAHYSISEQIVVSASVFDAGTFDATTPISDVVTNWTETDTASASSGALTATNAGGMVVTLIGTFADNVNGYASGWTALATAVDVGALCGAAAKRDAFTTASESVAAASFSTVLPACWTSATFVVNPG